MRVLVIGGSSFIGVYTADSLIEAGYSVVVSCRNGCFSDYYSSRGIECINLDLSDKSTFSNIPNDIDAYALIAGLLPANDSANLLNEDHAREYVQVNVLGTIELLEIARKNGVKRIVSTISYADVFNNWSETIPITEETHRDFKLSGDHAEYVISKNAMMDFQLYYNEQYEMKNMIFRLPPVYGVGPHGTLMVNGAVRKSGIQIFIDNAKEDKNITVFGNKDVKRDIVYVKDVASAFVKAFDSDAEGLYNIGSGKSTSLMEQADVIASVFSNGGTKVINVPEKDNGINGYSMSIEKAKKDFGYSPQYSDFADLMKDWKMEEERGIYNSLFKL